ncbi:hypothetical protein LTR40_007068 [Exophiala xenobiotica]|nr:hypothetical protein LTS06_012547 [Exophiala xenobiotica]KAK5279944.1 hypothetical protein LTR40_007068 [Exophiala xenobiotica]
MSAPLFGGCFRRKTLTKAKQAPGAYDELSSNAQGTFKSQRGPTVINTSHRHELALSFGRYQEATKKQSLSVWYHIKQTRSAGTSTTLFNMKFLLSNVPAANAATYSDIHELAMGEIARHHLAHQQSILDNPSSLSKTTAVASSENESLDSALIDPSPKRAALEDITNISQPPPATKDKDDASVPSREIVESTMTEMSHVIVSTMLLPATSHPLLQSITCPSTMSPCWHFVSHSSDKAS